MIMVTWRQIIDIIIMMVLTAYSETGEQISVPLSDATGSLTS